MESYRNNFDSPPSRPRQAWSGKEAISQAHVSPSGSDQSWVSSSTTDDAPTVDGSVEILNSFVGGTSTPVVDSRPMASRHNRPEGLSSPVLRAQSCSDNSLYTPSSEVTSPSGPTPIPRKRTPSVLEKSSRFERLNNELVQKMEKLQKENSELKSKLKESEEKISKLEETNHSLVTPNFSLPSRTQSSQRVQDLERDIEKLTQDLSQARLEPTTWDSPRELAEVKEELEQRTAEVSSLRIERRELEKKLSAMTLESYNASISSMAARTGGPNPPKRIEIKLNEAYKQLKEKESEIIKLKEKVEENNSGVVVELERTKARLSGLTKEKEELEQKHLANARQQKLELDIKVQELSQQLFSAQSELASLNTNYSLKCDELISASQLHQERDRECQELQEQLTALQEEFEQYRQSYSSTEEENYHTIEQLTNSVSSLEQQLQAMTEERDQLSEKHDGLSEDYRQIYEQNAQLRGEKYQDTVTWQETLEEIKREAGDTLGNYNITIEKLTEVERERDEFRMKNEQVMNILAQRGQELMAAKKALEECERRWSEHMEERLKKQRKELEDMQAVTSAQMVTYKEDFNEERRAREKMADEKIQLTTALKTKSEEIRVLKMKLNEQAAIAMHDDLESSHYSDDNDPPLRAQDPYQRIPFQGGPPRQNY